jgi:hypothetical protein
MGRTACTEPQCLYIRAILLLILWAVRSVQSLSACTRATFTLLTLNKWNVSLIRVVPRPNLRPPQGWPSKVTTEISLIKFKFKLIQKYRSNFISNYISNCAHQLLTITTPVIIKTPRLQVWIPFDLLEGVYCISFRIFYLLPGVPRWRSWLIHGVISRKVTGSISDGVIGIFHWHNPCGLTMALGLTQPLTEMSTRNISWGVKVAGA